MMLSQFMVKFLLGINFKCISHLHILMNDALCIHLNHHKIVKINLLGILIEKDNRPLRAGLPVHYLLLFELNRIFNYVNTILR